MLHFGIRDQNLELKIEISDEKIYLLTTLTLCKREKKGTQATRAASFAFRPLFQLSQLLLKRPIRIRRALFCMTDFTRECIAKGGSVAVEHEEVEEIFATECRRCDSHKNL